jgi:hypothetical protein
MKKFFAIAAFLAATTTANAAITVFLDSVTAGPMSNTTFEYRAEQAPGDSIRPGDFFTVYDVNGFVSATAPAGFIATDQNIGITPNSVVVAGDDASVRNVTFRKIGPGAFSGPSIDGFLIVSTISTTAFDNFTGRNTKDTGMGQGTNNDSIGTVSVPSAVPEPATMGLMGGALLGLGVLARRRKA